MKGRRRRSRRHWLVIEKGSRCAAAVRAKAVAAEEKKKIGRRGGQSTDLLVVLEMHLRMIGRGERQGRTVSGGAPDLGWTTPLDLSVEGGVGAGFKNSAASKNSDPTESAAFQKIR